MTDTERNVKKMTYNSGEFQVGKTKLNLLSTLVNHIYADANFIG